MKSVFFSLLFPKKPPPIHLRSYNTPFLWRSSTSSPDHHHHKRRKKNHESIKRSLQDFHETTKKLILNIEADPSKYISDPLPQTGDEAWKLLELGNSRFLKGELTAYLQHMVQEISPSFRSTLTKDQHPYATIISCSDSRVCPNLVFDEGLGEIFVIRVAGNVVDSIAIGSIEYGVNHLGTPLLVILGHQGCGAVKATATFLEANLESAFEGNIGAILKKIRRSIAKTKEHGFDFKTQEADFMNFAIECNVRACLEDILANSTIIKERVEKGLLKIVLAKYRLDDGFVELIK